MELEEEIASEAQRREEEEAFLNYLEKAGELTREWPDWKRSVIRSWPNGATPTETDEPEGESKSNGKIEPEDTD